MIAAELEKTVKVIEKLQKELPQFYGGFTKEIDQVKADMLALAKRLPRHYKKPGPGVGSEKMGGKP